MTEPGCARYLRDVHKFPLLTQAEEQALARRWRDHGDLQAMQSLVSSHLRLVVKLARSYRGYGRPLADLVAEGNIGLLQAVKGFDPDRGCRLAAYAICWIHAVIKEYVMRTWSLVRIGTTGPQRKLFFNLRQFNDRLGLVDKSTFPRRRSNGSRASSMCPKPKSLQCTVGSPGQIIR